LDFSRLTAEREKPEEQLPFNAKKGGMEMRISLVADDQASPVVRRIYQALEQRSGSVAPYFRVLAHKPDVLRAFNQLHAAIWADGALAAKLKHLAYLRVSILDGCGF
jgi:alkylhydroperoxidase family enzyme